MICSSFCNYLTYALHYVKENAKCPVFFERVRIFYTVVNLRINIHLQAFTSSALQVQYCRVVPRMQLTKSK
jgi:hypothetical protein